MSDRRLLVAKGWSGPLAAICLVLAPPATAQPLPDPTERTSIARPAVATRVPVPWVLQSTLIAEDRRIAVINGRTVTVGDEVEGARITRIEPYAVRLRTTSGIVELTLTDGDPKRAAGGGTR